MTIFHMNLNDFYLRLLYLILDRCARITFLMVRRTCRFCVGKHAAYINWILQFFNFHCLLPCHLQYYCSPLWFRGLFHFASISSSIITSRRHHSLRCCFILWIKSKRFCNCFIWAMLSVFLFLLQHRQRDFMNIMRSTALMFKIYYCA